MTDIIISVLILILAIIHHEYVHLFVLQSLGYEGKIVIKKHKKYCVLNTFGVEQNLKENIICAKDAIIVSLAPIPTGVVLFSCVFISSDGYFSLLAVMLGVVFTLVTSSIDIVSVIRIYKWWIKPSKNPKVIV